jgi:hypothetical protein
VKAARKNLPAFRLSRRDPPPQVDLAEADGPLPAKRPNTGKDTFAEFVTLILQISKR